MEAALSVPPDIEEVEHLTPKRRKRSRAERRLAPTEAMVQRSIIHGLQLFGVWAVHVANEGKRSDWGHMQAKRDGMVADFPDLLLYHREGRHGLLEVKRPGWKAPKSGAAGRAWERRVNLYDSLRSRGFPVEVVTSWDEAKAAIRAWGWAP